MRHANFSAAPTTIFAFAVNAGPSERALIHLFRLVWLRHPLLGLKLAKHILWRAKPID